MIEYTEARIGSIDHYTTDLEQPSGRPLYTARTLCDMALAGTPVAPTSSGQCEACMALLPCDECDHASNAHLWAPTYEALGVPAASEFIYDQATCWAENICRECSPALHAQALALVPAEAAANV